MAAPGSRASTGQSWSSMVGLLSIRTEDVQLQFYKMTSRIGKGKEESEEKKGWQKKD